MIEQTVIADREPCDLVGWVVDHRESIERTLAAGHAVLLRGALSGGPELLRRVVEALSHASPLIYAHQSTPRSDLGHNVYTATEYPSSQVIPLHNENAYALDWPMRLYFFCEEPAESGGETTLADTRRVTQRIAPAIRARFAERGVCYRRNYRRGLDLPWQRVFGTEQPARVEAICRELGIELEWRPNGALRTRQVCQGLATHPNTGERVWMNQAHLFHVSSLDEATRLSLLELFAEEDLPRHASYGDGSPIEPEVLDEVRSAFDAEEHRHAWQAGDLVIIDNMLCSHGRRPFSGRRKLLVAMSHPFAATR